MKIIILGTGGNCVDIFETLLALNESADETFYECVAFLDDDQTLWNSQLCGVPVSGPLEKAIEFKNCFFINGIGSPGNFWKKSDILSRTQLRPEQFASIVHPTASVSPSATIGTGTVVLQNVTIASNVTIGQQVIILPNSVISHDDVIGDYSSIAGGACISGGVTIGHHCYIGSNCSIIGNISIGDGSMVGIGSVVLKDVLPNQVVVGNPARVIRSVQSA